MTNIEKINLVFLPGILADEALFSHQIENLVDIAHCTVADLTGADNVEALATEVLEQAPATFAMVGFALGGMLALEIMRRAPDRVLALALISTSAYPSTSAEAANCLYLMTKAEDNFQIVLDQMMPTFLHPSRMEYHSNVTTVYSMGHRTGKDAFIRQQCATMNRIDGRPFLLGIACPTLVLCGNDDVLVPLELQAELAAGIPGADLKILPDAAHFLTIGKPDEVSTLLRSWLARVEAQRLTAATWQCLMTA